MRVTSLVAVVAPRTSKIIKNGLRVFEKGERRKFATKWYITLCGGCREFLAGCFSFNFSGLCPLGQVVASIYLNGRSKEK